MGFKRIKEVWRKGPVTVEELPGGSSFLMRFHADSTKIPGPILASCVITTRDGFEAEIKVWGGERGPTTEDKNIIKEFCQYKQFTGAYWWRYERGREKQVWIYQKFAH